jgi:DDE superfamily endonuclease
MQEEILIKYINDLSDWGIFSTTQIVKNLTEEIIQDKLGKNWVGNFVCWKKDKLKSLYLRNIDNMRIKADYVPNFKLFYDQVCFNLSCTLIYICIADEG